MMTRSAKAVRLGLWIGLSASVLTLAVGCRGKTGAHTASEVTPKTNTETVSKLTTTGDASTSRPKRLGVQSPKALPPAPDLRTAFRAVLASGFKYRPAKRSRATVKQCRVAFDSLLKHPKQLLEFAVEKMTEGRIFERPLAMKLLGRLGADAQSASRYVADVILRSWEIRFQRCLKSRIKWKKGLGQELDASPEVRAQCRLDTMKKQPGFDVRLACESLTSIGNTNSIRRLVESGVGGQFIQPCVDYFLTADLAGPAVLKFVAEEMHRPANRETVVDTLAVGKAMDFGQR